MRSLSLEPTGAHETPTGLTRYAIWEWRDADGVKRIPCGVIAALAQTRIPKNATCGGPWPVLRTHSRSLKNVARLHGLIDGADRVTELGLTVRLMFRRRDGVVAGWETAHGETVPF